MKLAKRLSRVQESATLKMAKATREAKAKERSIINFTVGEPNFPIPDAIQRAAVQAIHEGFSQYTPVVGIPQLRQRLSIKLREENNLSYTPEEIIVSCGAKQAFYNLCVALVEEGDEVIIPAPYWTSYPEIVKLSGGNPVIVPTLEKNEFKMSPDDLRSHLTPQTKMLVMNSPSNPTGSVYSETELKGLARMLEGSNVLVASDEIYEKLIFGETSFASFGAVSQDAFLRTVTISGFSKTYAMTGWRLGYAAGPRQIIDAMQLVQGQSTSGANSVTQKAALAALELTPRELQPLVDQLEQSRDQMVSLFSETDLISFMIPKGAFYLFLNISKLIGKADSQGHRIQSSEDLALFLLREAGVGTVAGSGFGTDAHLRLSFAASASDIDEGCHRMIAAFERLSHN